MTEKIRYFRIIVKCDEEVIHEEIAKVISSSEQPGNTKLNCFPFPATSSI